MRLTTNAKDDLKGKNKSSKELKSFVSFLKKAPGEVQKQEVVFRIEKSEQGKGNELLMFIGNPYELKLTAINSEGKPVSTGKVAVLQHVSGDLYLIVTNIEGARIVKPTNTWGKVTLSTISKYMFVKEESNPIDVNDIGNEYLFKIDENRVPFEAIGDNIEGIIFEGYKLTFVKKLKNKQIEKIEISDEEDIDADEFENIEGKSDRTLLSEIDGDTDLTELI